MQYKTSWLDYDSGEVRETEKRIKVIGIGGGGGNTVNSLYLKFKDKSKKLPMEGIDFVIMNSDSQDLSKSPVPNKIQIAKDGQGAGSDPERGRQYAEQCSKRIKDAVSGAYLLFITAGMGGGTGTGASPVVARLAREANPEALIVGVVTTPFSSTRNVRKTNIANEGIKALKEQVNALLIVSNDSILKMFPDGENYTKALRATDKVLMNAITGIVGIIKNVGAQNADFRDIYTIMQDAGTDVIIGVGSASGKDRYRLALQDALNSPLLCGRTIAGAKGIIVNFCSHKDNSDLNGVTYVMKTLHALADPEATYKDCTMEDPEAKDLLILTVIATNFVDERGYLVTYMKRAAAESGLNKQSYILPEQDIDLSLDAKEKKESENEDEIEVPDFYELLFNQQGENDGNNS